MEGKSQSDLSTAYFTQHYQKGSLEGLSTKNKSLGTWPTWPVAKISDSSGEWRHLSLLSLSSFCPANEMQEQDQATNRGSNVTVAKLALGILCLVFSFVFSSP